ncbi:hypothetical protein J5X84_20610 [Streptosporangiaceae bacterium NEAU-GS5]|nr:hypothetical protein [Streptosporangiaceae bacterium NEAU-GS5]
MLESAPPAERAGAGRCVHGLLATFTEVDCDILLDRLLDAAAAICRTTCAGFAENTYAGVVPVRWRLPYQDPGGVGAWVRDIGIPALTGSRGPVVMPPEPGFLAVPMALAMHAQPYLWVAGRGFDELDEHLLTRFATAAGRALEGARGFEAAGRLLRAVNWEPSCADPPAVSTAVSTAVGGAVSGAVGAGAVSGAVSGGASRPAGADRPGAHIPASAAPVPRSWSPATG